ncbi:MAG TPA: GIY-YIG nuclease family protein [Terriglobales bacterium]|nr:GIY-YIG nuclease family protein [Terriglobales bacterium]
MATVPRAMRRMSTASSNAMSRILNRLSLSFRIRAAEEETLPLCVLLETRNLWILERIWLEFVSVPRTYFVYILASLSGTLYVGVTNNLHRRRAQHKIGSADSFTTRYRVDRLVYFECYSDILKAIAREKEIKIGVGKRKSR